MFIFSWQTLGFAALSAAREDERGGKCLYEKVRGAPRSWFFFFFFSSQRGAQTRFVPPGEVLPLASGLVVLRRTVSAARSSIRTEAEAEASRAVADFEQAVGAEEGFSFASPEVVDRLQVVVDGDVSQLLSALLRPPSPREDNAHHQNQQQDG